MDRETWRREKRRMAETRYDTLFAHDYDEHWGHINSSHRTFLERFLARCRPGGTILDAACGTGKYWQIILNSQHRVMGIDQSQQMLNRAKAKFPDIQVEKLGIQEMHFNDVFAGIICMDAMEFVFPEDWPIVLSNFYRALQPSGHLYLTVEIIDAEELAVSQREAQRKQMPIVAGEFAHEASYHYYPTLGQVRSWLSAAHFTLVEEGESDGYYHLAAQKA